MSTLRKVGIVVLTFVLILTVATGNVVFAGHNTVLDPDFVIDTMEDEDAYEAFENAITEMIMEDADDSDADGEAEFMVRVIDRTITPAYVRSQINPNVYRTYEYLHGNRDDLELRFDTAPLVENIKPAIQEEIQAEPTGTLIAEFGDVDEVAEAELDVETIDRLEEGPEEFETARSTFRDAVREEVIEEMISELRTERTNDELLALIDDDYDPDAYTEAEKEEMVAENEDEIDAALRAEILEEEREVGEAVDETLDELVAERDAPDEPADIEEAGAALEATVVAGLADREMSYETYVTELEDAKSSVGTHLADEVAADLEDEFGKEIDVTEELDESTLQTLEDARTGIEVLDIAGIVLPLLALVLIALLWVVSRSIETVSIVTGTSFGIVGIPSLIVATVAKSRILEEIPEPTDPAEATMVEFVTALVTNTISTFQYQSLALAIVGVGLVAFGVAVRYGYVDLDELGNTETEE